MEAERSGGGVSDDSCCDNLYSDLPILHILLHIPTFHCLQYHSFHYYLLVLELTVALVMHCCFLLARSVVELVVVVTAFVIAESFSVLARSLLL